MGDEGIDQRAVQIACCRMNHQTCGLVDDNEMIILKDNIERNVLALRLSRLRWRQDDRDFKALFDPPRRVDYRRAVEGHLTLFNKPFDARPAQVRADLRQSPVKAQAVNRLIQLDFALFILLGHAFAMTDLNTPENPDSREGLKSMEGAISTVPLPLKIAVYGMGLALTVMLVLVASRFMDRKAERRDMAATQEVPWLIDLDVADLTESAIRSATIEGRILTVVVSGPTGDRVILIDTRKGEVVGKARLTTP